MGFKNYSIHWCKIQKGTVFWDGSRDNIELPFLQEDELTTIKMGEHVYFANYDNPKDILLICEEKEGRIVRTKLDLSLWMLLLDDLHKHANALDLIREVLNCFEGNNGASWFQSIFLATAFSYWPVVSETLYRNYSFYFGRPEMNQEDLYEEGGIYFGRKLFERKWGKGWRSNLKNPHRPKMG